MAAPSAEIGLFLDGLRCGGCVRRVEQALAALPGVDSASVQLTTQRALVRFDPLRVDAQRLAAEVAELGYEAVPYDPAALERPAERSARDALVRVLVAAFLAANVMLLSVALYIGSYSDLDDATRRALRWLVVALSLPAVTWCAAPFWRGALSGLRRRELTMDVPVVLGATTAFVVSIAGTLAETRHLYVDSAAMIVFLILLGRTLERRARARAAGAVERLAALRPVKAWLRGPEGVVPTDARALRPGDLAVVPAGEAVPADGRVTKGESEVDEALLSGESLPVVRRPGDLVTGGTRNLVAELEVEISAALGEGTLARLGALLERAAAEKPALQRLADRIAARFAPAVVGVGLATAAGWALAGADPIEIGLRASAVLIVACPCALGLATPAAVTAALGRAAALGILVKRGDALERCARVDSAILDKTGTLSEARFAVRVVAPAPGGSASLLLSLAAGAEAASSHPLGEALRAEAAARGLAPAPLEPRLARAGLGVEAGPAADRVLVGTRALLEEHGAEIPAPLDEEGRKLAELGLSLAWVARAGRALGVLGVADALRPDARAAVSKLGALGLRVSLLSGDHPRAVELAASAAGIETRRGGARPEDKVAAVRAARAAGRRVLVAGDGLNDAAALAAADVGVAMARGADVSLHAADVVIRSARLGALADLVELSRVTLSRIRENLALALGYNAIAVPLAVLGVLEPLHAAIAMSLSSLAVTGNAIRLLRWKPAP
jgi:heavy metal translocating P-type ATPase